MNKSFKNKVTDGSVTRIRLSTNNGLAGYQILKFQVMGEQPGTTNLEAVVQIFSTEKDATGAKRTATNNIDFNDPTLLAACHYAKGNNTAEAQSNIVIFDNSIFKLFKV